MQYQSINEYAQVNALNERIQQLEQAHYTNKIYLIEARKVGDQTCIETKTKENLQLDDQWQVLVDERDNLLVQLEGESKEE